MGNRGRRHLAHQPELLEKGLSLLERGGGRRRREWGCEGGTKASPIPTAGWPTSWTVEEGLLLQWRGGGEEKEGLRGSLHPQPCKQLLLLLPLTFITRVASSAAANILSKPSSSACLARRVMMYTRSSSATPGRPEILHIGYMGEGGA